MNHYINHYINHQILTSLFKIFAEDFNRFQDRHHRFDWMAWEIHRRKPRLVKH